jgi:methylmalonyl-CoA mutase N-terminal domain/subunit
LERAAQGSENLMPVFIEAAEADLTLGEICGVLRKTWGEYQPPATL